VEFSWPRIIGQRGRGVEKKLCGAGQLSHPMSIHAGNRALDTSGTELEPDTIADGNPLRRPGQQSRQPLTLVDTEF